jgi:hypothetical protein
MKDDEQDESDEMCPEYDFSKLKFVGRGIYAERYRAGVTFIVRDETAPDENENDNDDDEVER